MSRRQIFKIPSMHCSGCVMILEGIEDELSGIQKIRGSYQKATLEVQWDESRLTETEIKTAIQRLGYAIDEG